MLLKTSILYKAARRNDIPKVSDLLLNQPALLTRKTKDGKTLLHLVVEDEFKDLCYFLLTKACENDVNVNGHRYIDLKDDHRYSALKLAIMKRNVELVRLVLDFSPLLVDDRGWTALHDAAPAECTAITNAILDIIPRDLVNSCAAGGYKTPLNLAIKANQLDQASLLLANGANPNIGVDKTCNASALIFAVSKPVNSLAMVKLLVTYGANVNYVVDLDGSTVLHSAAQESNPEIVSYLLAHGGADAEIVSTRSNKPAWQLGCASAFFEAGYNNFNFVKKDANLSDLKFLSELGMNVETALLFCLQNMSTRKTSISSLTESYRFIQLQGLKLDAKSMETMLKLACGEGNIDIVFGMYEGKGSSKLLSAEKTKDMVIVAALKAERFNLFQQLLAYFKWPVEMQVRLTDDVKEWSLVHEVIADRKLCTDAKLEILSFLVDDMEYDLRDSFSNEGKSPLILACCEFVDISIVEFLVENGLRTDAESNNNTMPLHTLIAVCPKSEQDKGCKIASHLIAKGANLWEVNTEEKSALCLAAENKLMKLVTLIDRHARDEHLSMRGELNDCSTLILEAAKFMLTRK